MINFFRKTRKQLADDNKALKYFRYAIGEIVLVVIGILIALQINNWNEHRKQNEQFNLAIEQSYNIIDQEIQLSVYYTELYKNSVSLIDMLLENPRSLSDEKLPHILFYIDNGINDSYASGTHASNFSSNLKFDQDDIRQIKIAKEVTSYLDNKLWKSSSLENIITPILFEAGIPIPATIFGFTEFENFKYIDTSFFTKEELTKVRFIVGTDEFRKILRTLKANRIKIMELTLRNTIADGFSVLNSIKEYYPKVRLLYYNVGIIGTALDGYDNDGASSTPLKLSNAEKSIWETDLFLKNGTVKFRTRDSWNQNWGGKEFPKGDAIYYWDNIPVVAGNYHIIFNLSEKTYEFINQDY